MRCLGPSGRDLICTGAAAATAARAQALSALGRPDEARQGAGQPLGLAFGYPLPPGSRWWEGLVTPVEDGFTEETGTCTFALNELMVHPDHQRQGIARTLHDRLLGSRHEQRATLLVRADNAPARAAYAHWGWRTVAQLQPFPDSPVYDALILELPHETTNGPHTDTPS